MRYPTKLLAVVALGTFGALAAGGSARACGMAVETRQRHLDVWPAHTIAPDGVLMVTAHEVRYCGEADNVEDAFAQIARGGLYLEDDEGYHTPLAVEWRGGGDDAALLRPLAPLVVGKTYRFELWGTTNTLQVVSGDELAPPAWTDSAAATARGLASQLILRVPFATDGVARVALRATPLHGGAPVTRLLPLRFDYLDVAPSLIAGEPYRLELAAYDDLGRLVAMPAGGLDVRATAPLALHDADPEPLTTMALARLYALLLIGLGLALAFWVLAWRTTPAPPGD
jgi:hypothetical protein